jgi:hypothetical protein
MKKAKIEKKPEDMLKDLNAYCKKCDCTFAPAGDEPMLVRYCPDCGNDLILPSLCPFCGNPMNADAKFCTGCGIPPFSMK